MLSAESTIESTEINKISWMLLNRFVSGETDIQNYILQRFAENLQRI